MKEVFIGDSVAELFVFYSKGKLTINDVCIIDSMLTFGPIKKGPASKDRRDYFSKYYPKDDDMESFSKYWMIHRKWEENAQKLL